MIIVDGDDSKRISFKNRCNSGVKIIKEELPKEITPEFMEEISGTMKDAMSKAITAYEKARIVRDMTHG